MVKLAHAHQYRSKRSKRWGRESPQQNRDGGGCIVLNRFPQRGVWIVSRHELGFDIGGLWHGTGAIATATNVPGKTNAEIFSVLPEFAPPESSTKVHWDECRPRCCDTNRVADIATDWAPNETESISAIPKMTLAIFSAPAPASSWRHRIRGAIMFATTLCVMASQVALAQAPSLDQQINLWRKEFSLLTSPEIPPLEALAKAGDVRATYLLYLAGDDWRFRDAVAASRNNLAGWSKKLAESGNPIGMRMLCFLEMNGAGGAQKAPEQGFSWCEKAAEAGLGDAMRAVGGEYERGGQVTKNADKAEQWYDRAATAGNWAAMVELGRLMRGRNDKPQDIAAGTHWWQRAADLGSARAQALLGASYVDGLHLSKDVPRGLRLLETAGTAGDDAALYALGLLYQQGVVLEKNDALAAKFFLDSALRGNVEAMTAFALFSLHGVGVPQNDTDAFRWFNAAADGGHARGAYLVGWAYAVGRGTAKNQEQALKWYRLGAERNSPEAMYALRGLEENGIEGKKNVAAAMDWYAKAAGLGHVDAMLTLGYCYDRGLHVSKDVEQAVAWWRKAAGTGNLLAHRYLREVVQVDRVTKTTSDELVAWFRSEAEKGNTHAMNELGNLLAYTPSIKNPSEARKWWARSADLKNSYGLMLLGVAFEGGIGGEKSAEKAFELYSQSAKLGSLDGIRALGVTYRDGIGTVKDATRAFENFQKATDLGDVESYGFLATAHINGQGTAKNPIKGVELYQAAVERGNASAMVSLGYLYETGKVVRTDKAKAFDLYSQAANAGNIGGMRNLAFAYRDGDGVKRDFRKAAEWFERAAKLGDGRAMASLANLYRRGEGVARDYDEMLRWIRAAIDAGDTYGYTAMGEAYHNGQGVPEDLGQAIQWWEQGAAKGDGVSAAQLARLYLDGRGVTQNFNRAADFLVQARDADSGATWTDTGLSLRDDSKRRLDDLIAERSITDAAVLRRVKGISAAAPDIRWVTAPTKVDEESATLRLAVADGGGGIGRVELRVNGAAVGEFQNTEPVRAASASDAPSSARVMQYSLRLNAGEHQIEVWAYNAENRINFSTLTATIRSAYEPPRKPRLFAVVVGINEYENSRLKLKFAGSDALAIGKVFEQQIASENLYSGGEVRVLTSKADTSKARITSTLRELQNGNKVRGDDVFVLFVASHGDYDADTRRYTMFSSDVLQMSADRLATTGISGEELQGLVRNIVAQKKLILLDTCHAGSAIEIGGAQAYYKRSGTEEQQIINTMKNRSGATILAASNSDQAALEGYKGHGVFTWHLLEGLNGKAARAGSTLVSTDDLKVYVEDQVPITTEQVFKHKQSPYSSTLGQGFPVAVKR